MLKIGTLTLECPFIAAPLAGVTDAPTRMLAREQGAALAYSEMISAKGLYYGSRNTEALLRIYEGDHPLGYQLFGSEPEILGWAARELESRGNEILDLNSGCPVPKIVRNGEGSALMKNVDLLQDVVKAMADNTSKPVTVKIRAGWDADSVNAVEAAKAAEAAGAAAVTVHGRTRAQFYEGKADWSVIADVKKAVDIPVIGNGDVMSGRDAMDMMERTGCDFVMIARGMLGNPWIFREARALWRGERAPDPPSREERAEMMVRHFEMLCDTYGERRAVPQMRKFAAWYVKGQPGAAAFRRRVNSIENADEMREAFMETAAG